MKLIKMKLNQQAAFSDNPWMLGYDTTLFEHDVDLGFRFPQGGLVSKNGFVSLDDLLGRLKQDSSKRVVLNVGDSSTSGWDSNRTFLGNKDSTAPFFTYKTYSDLLEEQFSAHVINAGVPGYTSYQGKKKLERLLKQLAFEEVAVAYVTIYLGNNDGTYNKIEDKERIDRKCASIKHHGERVTVADYQRNLTAMIELAREYGARPVLIVPAVRYDWEHGIRADKHREESLEILRRFQRTPLGEEVRTAQYYFQRGDYRKALEWDRVLPRLKMKYRKALFTVAKRTRTPVVDVQKQIPTPCPPEYFADYCHPKEPINQMIIDQLAALVEKDKIKDERRKKRCKLVSWFTEDEPQDKSPPSDMYTIY